MRVGIYGAGYVGLVTAVGLSEIGHEVTCTDTSREKLEKLESLGMPFYEPGLEEMLHRNVAEGRLSFTSDGESLVAASDVLFIAVGTPALPDGFADLSGVIAVAETIGSAIRETKVIVTKSTVPLGTTADVKRIIDEAIRSRGLDFSVEMVSNPEFLKEGSALDDFMKPDRIVLGVETDFAKEVMLTLYRPFQHRQPSTVLMDIASAELTKYAANAMLASRISLMNEIAAIAEVVGADIEQVRQGVGSDPRIGYAFLYAGCGFGGSCFPKDLRALRQTAIQQGTGSRMLRAISDVNDAQKGLLFYKLNAHFQGCISDKTIAIWGLSFKPDTDDIRDSLSFPLIYDLHRAGTNLRLFDPRALSVTRAALADLNNIFFATDMYSALDGADALVLVTEWKQFRSPMFGEMRDRMRGLVILDGRNQWNPSAMEAQGFTYYGVGRGRRTPPQVGKAQREDVNLKVLPLMGE